MNEIIIHQNNTKYPAHLYPTLHETNPDPRPANAVTLDFADQKNGKKGENITHNPSGHQVLCPCQALVRRVCDMREHHPSPVTQYNQYWDTSIIKTGENAGKERGFKPVTRAMIGFAIKRSATAVSAETGIDPARVSASSFRPGGATALLCGKIDKHTIKLLGRWRSDAIDTYLQTGR